MVEHVTPRAGAAVVSKSLQTSNSGTQKLDSAQKREDWRYWRRYDCRAN